VGGNHFLLAKSALKYRLVAPRTFKAEWIPSEKFNLIPYAVYLSIFGDMGYVHSYTVQPGNRLPNSMLSGTGIGIDFATYYSTVFRLEYTFNRMGENALFVHFALPI
jgi:hypothetical protein